MCVCLIVCVSVQGVYTDSRGTAVSAWWCVCVSDYVCVCVRVFAVGLLVIVIKHGMCVCLGVELWIMCVCV